MNLHINVNLFLTSESEKIFIKMTNDVELYIFCLRNMKRNLICTCMLHTYANAPVKNIHQYIFCQTHLNIFAFFPFQKIDFTILFSDKYETLISKFQIIKCIT